MLASFLGVPTEPKANPNDTAYIPRPEWYFLFLFQMLKYFPGKLEWVGTAVIPGIAILVLLLLPFLDRNQNRHYSKRKIALTVMGVVVTGIVGLTIIASVTTPPQEPVAAAGTIPSRSPSARTCIRSTAPNVTARTARVASSRAWPGWMALR